MDEKCKLLGNLEKFLKVFDENSLEKFIFLIFYFLENLLLKIEPWEITPFFYNNFFGFGMGISPFPPGYALAPNWVEFSIVPRKNSSYFWKWCCNYSWRIWINFLQFFKVGCLEPILYPYIMHLVTWKAPSTWWNTRNVDPVWVIKI